MSGCITARDGDAWVVDENRNRFETDVRNEESRADLVASDPASPASPESRLPGHPANPLAESCRREALDDVRPHRRSRSGRASAAEATKAVTRSSLHRRRRNGAIHVDGRATRTHFAGGAPGRPRRVFDRRRTTTSTSDVHGRSLSAAPHLAFSPPYVLSTLRSLHLARSPSSRGRNGTRTASGLSDMRGTGDRSSHGRLPARLFDAVGCTRTAQPNNPALQPDPAVETDARRV